LLSKLNSNSQVYEQTANASELVASTIIANIDKQENMKGNKTNSAACTTKGIPVSLNQ
jgi:hypothetical protein